MCSATGGRRRTRTIEPASTFHPPFGIIWGSDLWAWSTGDLLSKRRCRLDPGQCRGACLLEVQSELLGSRLRNRMHFCQKRFPASATTVAPIDEAGREGTFVSRPPDTGFAAHI